MSPRVRQTALVALAAAGAALVAVPIAYAAAVEPVFALGGAVALAMGLLVMLRADLLLLVLVAALPWEGSLAPPTSPVPVVKILGVVLIAAWAIHAARGRGALRLPLVLVPVAAFTFMVGVSFLASPDPSVSQLKTTSFVLHALFFFIVVQLVRDRDDLRRLLMVLTVSAAGSGLRGLYEFVVAGAPRAAGPILDPNGFGYVLASVLPLAGYLVLRRGKAQWFWAICFACIAAGVLASLSRGAFVGLAGVAMWALLTGRVNVRKTLIGALFALAIGGMAIAAVLPDVETQIKDRGSYGSRNISSRQAFWRGALAMTADRPWAGIGPARFGTEAQHYVRRNPVALVNPVVHNSYLEVMAESGVFALAAFLAFLATTYRVLARGRRRVRRGGDDDASRLASVLQSTLLVAVISGMFISAELTTPFWLIGGLATVFAGIDEPQAVADGQRRRALTPSVPALSPA